MHSGDRLRKAAKEEFMRPIDLSRALKESSQNINAWFNRGVPAAKMHLAAKAVNRSEEWLREGSGDSLHSRTTTPGRVKESAPDYLDQIPIIGSAQAGPDGYWDDLGHLEHGDGFITASSKDPDAYALRVRGDSMAPAIKNGQIVVIEPSSPPHLGENVLVCTTDGLCMIKELRLDNTIDNEYTLGSINDNHHAITVQKINVTRLHPVTMVVVASKRQA